MKKDSAKWIVWYGLARRLAALSAVFTAVVAILLTATYIQTALHDPLDNPGLAALREKLTENPRDDVIREGIRVLDLQARRAYFVSQDQVRTGALLLLAGLCILLASLKLIATLRHKVPPPASYPGNGAGEWLRSRTTRRALTIGGAALCAAGLVASVSLHSALRPKILTRLGAAAPTATELPLPPAAGTPAPTPGWPSPEEQQREWPAFRGVGSLGHAFVSKAAVNWDGKTGTGIVWKVKVPKSGFSSPVAWDGHIFLTGADKASREVYCFALSDGKLLWTRPMPTLPDSPRKFPEVSDDTGFAAPTMVTDGRRAAAIFGTGELLCVDMDGNTLWAKNLGVPENHYGHSSSLQMYEDLLLIQYDQGKSAQIIALESETGNEAWRRKRDVEICWASPIIANTGKRMELILAANPFVISYDPKSGSELWRVKCLGGEVGPSAAYANGMVFAANEYSKIVGIRVADASIVWESEEYLPNCASPVATDRYVFVATSDGILACYDAMKGNVLWEHELDNGFYSSPIIVGELVYVLDLKGTMHVFEAAGAFKSVGTPSLGEPAVCTPVFIGDRIILRGFNNLYCVGS